MAIPLSYNVRSIRARPRVAALCVLGVGLVVAVFVVLLSMAEGFSAELRSTGRLDNAIVVGRGSSSALTSQVRLEHRHAILADPRVARRQDGTAMASWELVVIVALPRKSDGRRTNVTLRAVPPQAFEVHVGPRVTAGRPFTPGLPEVIVGRRIAERIGGLDVGGTLRFRRRELRIVGLFESQGPAFESEIWGDFDTLGAFFERGPGSNVLVVRMKDPREIADLDRWIRSQPNMPLKATVEAQYYDEMAGPIARLLAALATLVSIVMGTGAVFGAMNTMYAVVAARTREIGTLRALGFSRLAVLASFVAEAGCLSLLGGALGCALALPVHGLSTAATNVQTFSEVAFAFRITPAILASALLFALVMGLVGGLLPAVRAARLPIAEAIR